MICICIYERILMIILKRTDLRTYVIEHWSFFGISVLQFALLIF
jgi:hypothetical protein